MKRIRMHVWQSDRRNNKQRHSAFHSNNAADAARRATVGDSLRGSSVNIGTIQRRLAWPLRKDDTHTSRSVRRATVGMTSHRRDREAAEKRIRSAVALAKSACGAAAKLSAARASAALRDVARGRRRCDVLQSWDGFGVVWCGAVRCGAVLGGGGGWGVAVVWRGAAWRGAVWHGVLRNLVSRG